MPGNVGVAPGTTTIFIPSQQNTLGWACGADSPWVYITPPGYVPPYPSNSGASCPPIYLPPYAPPAMTLTPQELGPQAVPASSITLTPQNLPPQTVQPTLYPQRLPTQTIPLAPVYPSSVPAQIATSSPSSVSTRAEAANAIVSQGYSLPRTSMSSPTTTLPYSAPRTPLAPVMSTANQLRSAQECQNRRYLNPYATESLLRDAAVQGTFNGFGSGFSTTLGIIAGLVTGGTILTYLLSRKI